MSAKNFINFHVLISHSPSCLNRDDMNLQKTAVFGGVTRVRISSQSLKRAMRISAYYQSHFSRSVRTRFLIDEAVTRLVKNNAGETQAIEAGGLIIAALLEGKTKPDEIKKYKRNEESGRIQHQVIPFSSAETSALDDLIIEIASKTEKERVDFAKDRFKEVEQGVKKNIELDVALSGRMAASDLLYGTDGAMAVAHAITTHAVEPQDVDWFTAVDDLQEQGSGHLDTQQFSSGVFYRYASLNLKQLQVNLGLIENMKVPETAESRARALEVAKHMFHMLATVVPSAKQQTFAAHNPADFAIVSFADQPISLANAFESPVKANSGYLAESTKKLAGYWHQMNQAYALNERAGSFALDGQPRDGLKLFTKLPDIEAWIAKDGAE